MDVAVVEVVVVVVVEVELVVQQWLSMPAWLPLILHIFSNINRNSVQYFATAAIVRVVVEGLPVR